MWKQGSIGDLKRFHVIIQCHCQYYSTLVYPAGTRRCFNVHLTLYGRQMDVETTLCASWYNQVIRNAFLVWTYSKRCLSFVSLSRLSSSLYFNFTYWRFPMIKFDQTSFWAMFTFKASFCHTLLFTFEQENTAESMEMVIVRYSIVAK